MRYVIIGAGAAGGSVDGRLAEAGRQVVLVARGAHREVLRERGLTLRTPDGTRTHCLPVVESVPAGPRGYADGTGQPSARDVNCSVVRPSSSRTSRPWV
ncbi:hypothetical protein GCM10010252_39220 [Streptomyces aureoverticillatus]|nr:hypothetical protein GCM10010252_39220 [Streptomyces aureoverticillatus]